MLGPAEMTQHLRTHTVLVQNLGLGPSIHISWLTTTCNSRTVWRSWKRQVQAASRQDTSKPAAKSPRKGKEAGLGSSEMHREPTGP